jgi:hypothetical protein
MKTVVQLMHSQADPEHQNRKRIGLYQSETEARVAIEELKSLPGFRNPGGSFSLHECFIDHDYLPYGFDVQDAPVTSADVGSPNIKFEKLFLVYSEPMEPERYKMDAVIFIGYYSSKQVAENAIRRFYELKIFNRNETKIDYSTVYLNQTNWTSGYATVEETMKGFR